MKKFSLLFMYLSILLSNIVITSNANTNVNIANHSANHYHPSLETSYKVGNVRQIGRASLLLPIWQKENQLLYFNAIGMMDNKNSQEGNFALGYRHKLNTSTILGGYAFYDRKSSPNNNLFHQITVGLELLKEDFEFRVNSYLPINRKEILSQSVTESLPKFTGAGSVLNTVQKKPFESVLRGCDVELGGTIPKTPIDIYGGYYYFSGKDVPTVTGPRLRGKININDWLSIGGEVQYDKPRGTTYYVGVELRAILGKSEEKLSKLDRKMTQMPVRDIDIVVLDGEERREFERDLDDLGRPIIMLNNEEDLRKLVVSENDEELSRTYVLEADIIADRNPYNSDLYRVIEYLVGRGIDPIIVRDRKALSEVSEGYYILVKDVLVDRSSDSNDILIGSEAHPFTGEVKVIDFFDKYKLTPIGSEKHPFTGKFYGSFIDKTGMRHDNKIAGFVIKGDSPGTGLFSHTRRGAHISHVWLDNAVLSIHDATGGLVGNAKDTTISYVVSNGHVEGRGLVGGIVGFVEDNVSVHASINTGSFTGDCSGAIVGGGGAVLSAVNLLEQEIAMKNYTSMWQKKEVVNSNLENLYTKQAMHDAFLVLKTLNYERRGLREFNKDGVVVSENPISVLLPLEVRAIIADHYPKYGRLNYSQVANIITYADSPSDSIISIPGYGNTLKKDVTKEKFLAFAFKR